MVKIFFYTTILLAVLFSCDNPKSKDESVVPIKSGGEITIPLNSYFKVTKPTRVVKIESSQINGQILENLVKYNSESLQIIPALAEKWELSEDGLTYKFYIRKHVKFHDNDCFPKGLGREVITQDVVDMFYRLYKNELSNTAYSMFQNTIVGGDEYYEGTAESISGIVFDENSVSVTLVEMSNTFLSKLITAYGSIVPNEAYIEDDYSLVGTGPFVYNVAESNSELVVLYKNKNYWMKDSNGVQLPYLDKLSFKFYENDDERMDDFWSNNVAIVKNVPITKVSEVLEERIADFKGKNAKFILESVPEMATSYLEFNMRSEIFKDPKVRQAINLAIDRKKLVETTLKNQAYEIGKFGITPPLPKIYEGYDFENIEKSGYTLNSVRAKELLAEAGYPNGENFPELTAEFKMDTDRYLIMSEIQNQLKSVLNINMAIEQVEFNKLLENISIGSADIFQQVWVGDFTSPESFLINYYGKIVPEAVSEPSLTNGGRYINENFDKLFEKGLKARNLDEANDYFGQAEIEVLKDPALAVLFYGETLWLMQANIKNFHTNGMNYLDFTQVYIQNIEPEIKK